MATPDTSAVTEFIPEALSIHARQLRHYIANIADRIEQCPPDGLPTWRGETLSRARNMLIAFEGLVLAAQHVTVIRTLNVEQLEAQADAARRVLQELESAA